MNIRYFLALSLLALFAVLLAGEASAQDGANDTAPDIRFEVVSKLLNSNVRNGIGLRDLNGDNLPDLVLGSNAHRFDAGSGTVSADPNASFRTSAAFPDHYQVSIHFNESNDASTVLADTPELQVPISAGNLIVPPG
ncbi:MAG: hypothetical protein AAF456_09495 [Planctomycetota bacterium]